MIPFIPSKLEWNILSTCFDAAFLSPSCAFLTNIKLKLQFIKSEKEKNIKSQLYEKASSIRDYEKEILYKINNLKTNNKMKQELLKIYSERQNDFKRIIELFPDKDLAGCVNLLNRHFSLP